MKRLFVFVVATLLMACVKQLGEPEAALPPMKLTSPTIRITAPRDGQGVSAGQAVAVTATITDDKQLEKVRLFVLNKATGDQVLFLETYLDVKSYNLSAAFTPEAGFMYTIVIQTTDLKNNNAESHIGVVCN